MIGYIFYVFPISLDPIQQHPWNYILLHYVPFPKTLLCNHITGLVCICEVHKISIWNFRQGNEEHRILAWF
jgi:hypothetical protein